MFTVSGKSIVYGGRIVAEASDEGWANTIASILNSQPALVEVIRHIKNTADPQIVALCDVALERASLESKHWCLCQNTAESET